MRVPQITGYRIEEVQIPGPRDDNEVPDEVLGITGSGAPEPPPITVLKITIDADDFPDSEMPLMVTIGDQSLSDVTVSADGKTATAYIDHLPSEGDAIAFNVSPDNSETLLAGNFEMSKLDNRIV